MTLESTTPPTTKATRTGGKESNPPSNESNASAASDGKSGDPGGKGGKGNTKAATKPNPAGVSPLGPSGSEDVVPAAH